MLTSARLHVPSKAAWNAACSMLAVLIAHVSIHTMWRSGRVAVGWPAQGGAVPARPGASAGRPPAPPLVTLRNACPPPRRTAVRCGDAPGSCARATRWSPGGRERKGERGKEGGKVVRRRRFSSNAEAGGPSATYQSCTRESKANTYHLLKHFRKCRAAGAYGAFAHPQATPSPSHPHARRTKQQLEHTCSSPRRHPPHLVLHPGAAQQPLPDELLGHRPVARGPVAQHTHAAVPPSACGQGMRDM